MMVYALPLGCPAPQVDYLNFDLNRVTNDERRHRLALQAHLLKLGYTGKNTGKIVNFPVADGYAQYMIMEHGKTFALVHLPYGDAYKFPWVIRLTKRDVLARAQDII
jgi:hypothetical protein